MEENLLSIPPDFKLYKDRAIYVGTFLGGPLVAGYLAAENFKQLGEQSKVKTAWAIAIAATIVLIGTLLFVPDIDKVPRYIIPIAYALIAQYVVKKNQGEAIKEHIEKGGQTYSVWRAVWIGLVCAVITVGIILGLVLITDKDAFTGV
jgi:ABC-type iron transport system FetAB permease component